MTHTPMKTCADCKTEKPLTGFYKSGRRGDLHSSYCKPCQNIRTTAWKHANADKREKTERKSWLKTAYGLSVEEYDRLLVEQCGVCFICRTAGNRRLSVDHDHATGVVRGLLCNSCNMAIGLMKDDPRIIQSAVRYLRLHAPSPLTPTDL